MTAIAAAKPCNFSGVKREGRIGDAVRERRLRWIVDRQCPTRGGVDRHGGYTRPTELIGLPKPDHIGWRLRGRHRDPNKGGLRKYGARGVERLLRVDHGPQRIHGLRLVRHLKVGRDRQCGAKVRGERHPDSAGHGHDEQSTRGDPGQTMPAEQFRSCRSPSRPSERLPPVPEPRPAYPQAQEQGAEQQHARDPNQRLTLVVQEQSFVHQIDPAPRRATQRCRGIVAAIAYRPRGRCIELKLPRPA